MRLFVLVSALCNTHIVYWVPHNDFFNGITQGLPLCSWPIICISSPWPRNHQNGTISQDKCEWMHQEHNWANLRASITIHYFWQPSQPPNHLWFFLAEWENMNAHNFQVQDPMDLANGDAEGQLPVHKNSPKIRNLKSSLPPNHLCHFGAKHQVRAICLCCSRNVTKHCNSLCIGENQSLSIPPSDQIPWLHVMIAWLGNRYKPTAFSLDGAPKLVPSN